MLMKSADGYSEQYRYQLKGVLLHLFSICFVHRLDK